MRCLIGKTPVGALLVLLAVACPAAASPTGGTAAGPFVTGTPEGGAPAPPVVPEQPRAVAAGPTQQEEPQLGEPSPDEPTNNQQDDSEEPIDVGVPQDELPGSEGSEAVPVEDASGGGGLASTGFAPLMLAGGGLLLVLVGLATRRSSAPARGGAG
jgi:hypothetical protein